eukprot:scaffold57187_cov70-Phaeocystis_antarctica.AAC.2
MYALLGRKVRLIQHGYLATHPGPPTSAVSGTFIRKAYTCWRVECGVGNAVPGALTHDTQHAHTSWFLMELHNWCWRCAQPARGGSRSSS